MERFLSPVPGNHAYSSYTFRELQITIIRHCVVPPIFKIALLLLPIPQMQKVIVPKQLKEISRVLFGNLPSDSLVRTGLKAYNKKPIANQIGLANPRSIQEILRKPLSFPTDDFILNGYTPYQWMRYSEMVSDPFAKKQAGLLVDDEELFYYRHAKNRRIVNGYVAASYKTDADDYWEKKARRKRFQGKGPPKKGENAKKGK